MDGQKMAWIITIKTNLVSLLLICNTGKITFKDQITTLGAELFSKSEIQNSIVFAILNSKGFEGNEVISWANLVH